MMWFWFFPFVLLLLVPLMFVRHLVDGGCCGMSPMHGNVPPQPSGPVGKDPVEIVRERLARGEITAAEYEEIRKVLG
jgi:uncharacterized membrane protein